MIESILRDWVEWFGYFASLVVLISLTMTSIIKLRFINLIGCLLFATFAYFIDSWPTLAMNLGIAAINLYFLYGIYSTKEQFKIVSTNIDSEFLWHFIRHNEQQITMQSSIQQLCQANQVFYLLRDNNIAGLLIGTVKKDGCFDIYLDYVLPRYRDYKLGAYYFKTHRHFLKEKGVKSLNVTVLDPVHQDYLIKMGFTVDPENNAHFQKVL